MAPTQWSNLPGDILSVIVKLLNSDVDLLRLRSVCSSWRSSLPTRMKPYSFPMKVPPVFSNPNSSTLRGNEHYSLNYSTLYRLSPPDYAGDSSDGWLLRVLEVKPNTFSLLTPLLPEKIGSRNERIPECINLLNYRISEICKCYQLDFVHVNGSVNELGDNIRKVIVLWNFVEDCDFAVLILVSNNDLRYWKFGDKDWTSIDIQGCEFDDVIFFDGKCYAIGWKGEIYSFDSEFNMAWVFSPRDLLAYNHNNFVVNKSQLFIMSKIYNREPDEYSLTPEHSLSYYDSEGEEEYEDEDEGSDEEEESSPSDPFKIPLRVKIFGISNDWEWEQIFRITNDWQWEHFNHWRDDEFFLSSDDVSAVLSTKDFGGCKGNCVYMAHKSFSFEDRGIEHGDHHGVFDFDGFRMTTLVLEGARNHAKIYWPPPNWLSDGSSSSRF